MHHQNRNEQMFAGGTESLLNESRLARIIGMSLASVRRWRLVGDGPGS